MFSSPGIVCPLKASNAQQSAVVALQNLNRRTEPSFLMHLLTWETDDGHENDLRLRLEQDADVIRYAILSHRWGNPKDEVSFDDMLAGTQRNKGGYNKLLRCCKQAQKDGLRYVWIDTCCINKASSAELSEAINSMFSYYERSEVCYAFLDDVETESSDPQTLALSSFPQSVWFTRGWTLQELIAPRRVNFYNSSWSFLGDKTRESLSSILESVTGIDEFVLETPATVQVLSIAKRISWAARRRTTRIEDRAYSLMGIFGVYMPPLYGEGYHSFIRLQEAIMRISLDHTIFAWTSPPISPPSHGLQHVSTMLAFSPDQFEFSSNFVPLRHSKGSTPSIPNQSKLDFSVTNAGLSIRLPLQKIQGIEGLHAAFLACTDGKDEVPAAIFLQTSGEIPPGLFWRACFKGRMVEISDQPWFQTSGRGSVKAIDVYIVPRFSSASSDHIETSWNQPVITETRLKEAEMSCVSLDAEVLKDLELVPDPYSQHINFLRQVQELISSDQPHQRRNLIHKLLRYVIIIPKRRNKLFYGRAAVIEQLLDHFFPTHKRLSRKGGQIPSCTISGMGGIGKTEVAVELSYICLQKNLVDAVLWVSAEYAYAFEKSFQDIARILGIHTRPGHAVFDVVAWLSDVDRHANIPGASTVHSTKWLLVFDGVEDAILHLRDWPMSGPGCVLVTGRNPDLWSGEDSKHIALEFFTSHESSEFMKKLTGKDWDFTALTEWLGGLPLALNLMADFIRACALSQKRVQNIFRAPKNWLKYRGLHRFSLQDTWAVSLDQLLDSSQALLQVMSFLNPELIQDSILIASQPVELSTFPQDETDLFDSQDELVSAGLLQRSPEHDGSVLHRMIQLVVRTNMSPDECQRALSTAVILVSAWTNANHDGQCEAMGSEPHKDLLPHVAYLKNFATEMTQSEKAFNTKTIFDRLLNYIGQRL